MDLSKAFDCLPHDLLIAKMKAYGIGTHSLNLIFSYLSNRHQRVRIGSTVSDWLKILLGVPQGSILGPLLFNIFINDIFLFITSCKICNFADDNTLYACGVSVQDVIFKLTSDMASVMEWFNCNSMVVNPDKFQLIFPGSANIKISLNVNGNQLMSMNKVELLGITIDHKLTFYPHIVNICKTANKKD